MTSFIPLGGGNLDRKEPLMGFYKNTQNKQSRITRVT